VRKKNMASPPTDQASRSSGLTARDLFAGIAGNVMEWYDFAVYGYFAGIIGTTFFPNKDPRVSLLAAFGVFAGGYLMRPLGGLVFGHIGDRLGRRRALTVSSLLMGIPTALIGFTPTYEQIGLWAPAGILLLRLLQGLSVGGEYTSSAVFIVEHAPVGRRGFYGSWVVWGSLAGVVIGSGTAALLTSVLSPAALGSWGWRLPFVAGIVIATYSFVLRRGLAAEPAVASDGRLPIVEAVRDHWRAMLQGAGLSLTIAVAFYTVFVYVVTYIELFDRLPASRALDINTLNMVAMLILLPFFGWLSDHIGRKAVALGSALAIAVLAWPLFTLIHSDAGLRIFLGQFGFAVLIAAYASLTPTILVEAFPRDVRCSAVSTSYNLVLGIFGGTAPIFATYLIQRTHDDLSPAYYIMAAALVSAMAIFTMERRT
jgi:MHS family proline/betaine transporter-like MFS transporter